MMHLTNGADVASTHKHTFNRAAETTLARADKISNQRAGEYHDSWGLENLQTPYLDNLLRDFPAAPKQYAREYKRLVVMSSMIDIKISRMGGGWKDDTCLDLINYVAAYCQLRNEFNDHFIVGQSEQCSARSIYTEGVFAEMCKSPGYASNGAVPAPNLRSH